MTRTRPLVLAASLALAACSSMVDPDKIKPTGPATAGALCQEVTSAFIDRVVECLGVPRAWAQQPGGGPNCSRWDASVAAGRLRYDSFYGDACISLLRTMPCDQLFGGSGGGGPPGACALALQGLVQAGSACVTDEDCAGGTYCDFKGACGGACNAYATLGQQCQVGGVYTQCAPGLFCIADPAPATTSTCQSPIVQGSPCPAGWGCADGLFCDRSATPYRCQPQQTSGSCTQDDGCLRPRYHCSRDPIALSGNCRPVALETQNCTNGYGDCVGGTYCNTGGTPPAVGVSGTCIIYPGPPSVCGTYGAEWIECLGSSCSATTGQGACAPYIPLGNSCAPTGPSDQCGPGNYCTLGPPNVCAVACP